MASETLDYPIGAFIFEVRQKNGDEYKGNTLYQIVIAIQHFLRENSKFVTLLDDAEFEGKHCKLYKKMKDLAAKGEEKMWRCGILASDTLDKMRDTLLYLLGLNFALQGGQEHYNLRHGENSQLRLGTDNNGRKYLEYHGRCVQV
ncbi:Zinc finger MYM-type protein 3 [Mizuhopecten yessoensis]|uniref:Zinc finger MYM-type protein 3 n=1 Tax=Mizuhopecten yessoensis TaxID=6573 RepID=A0A210PKD8_MIZYE|nr:Zinc finger MYM-type protein 3 [Mizuhopecten yessoensis]